MSQSLWVCTALISRRLGNQLPIWGVRFSYSGVLGLRLKLRSNYRWLFEGDLVAHDKQSHARIWQRNATPTIALEQIELSPEIETTLLLRYHFRFVIGEDSWQKPFWAEQFASLQPGGLTSERPIPGINPIAVRCQRRRLQGTHSMIME